MNAICLTGSQSHYSIKRAAMIAGFGMNNCIKVKTDRKGCMIISDLESKLIDDNPKGKLQEYLQQKNQKAPNYITKSVEGPDHNPQHTIAVVAMNKTFTAIANSKREAEQQAARQALEWIRKKSN